MALVLSLSQAVRPNLAPATLKPWRAPPGLPGHRSIGRRDGESRDVSSYTRCVAACLGVAVATSRRRRIARSAGAVEPDDSQEFEDYDDEKEESIPRGEYDEDLGMAEEMDPEEMEQIMRALQGGEGSRVSETGDLMGDGTLLKSIIQEAPRMAMRPQLGDEVSVHFVGTLLDGKVFDESRKRRNGDPFKFRMGGIDSTAQSSGGCAYVHPECSREPHAKFLQLWAEKTRCWLCDNQDLVNAAQGVLRDLLHTDRPTIRPMDQLSDNEAALDPIWQQTCLSSYLLALFSSTRSQVVQPWYFYELGLSIVHGCSYDEAVFFGHFEITPKQVAYTFYVLGLAYGMPSAMMNLQLPELGPQGLPEHGLPPMEEASLVFDIGMGLGADTRYFLSQGFRVVAVEANKKAIDVALGIEWVKPHVLSGRLTFLHAAIAPYGQGGGVTKIFALPQRPEQSNAQEWVEDAGGLPELVRTVECADLLRIFGKATYMKIDVESSTIDCLESIHSQVTNSSGSSERRPALPKFISLELEAASLKDRFHQLLRRLGYSSYKACRQYIYSPAPCEIGSYSDDVPGCGSGPFGDAAVDYLRGPKWTPIDELPNDGGFVEEFERGLDWFDIHAQLAGD